MHYSEFMSVLDSTDNLLKDFASLLLIHPFLADNIVKQLTPLHVLHDKEEMFGSFDDLIQLNDIGMPNQLQNVDLSRYSFHIGYVYYPILLKDLDGHFLTRWNVGCQLYFAECAFS